MCSEGYSTWCFCLIVVSCSYTTGYEAAYNLCKPFKNENVDFPETTAFQRYYAVKTSKKADILIAI